MTDEGQVLDMDMPVEKEAEETFERFSLLFRLQHIGMAVGVIILIITGLPLKFADTAIASAFFRAIGGVAVSGMIHRIGAVILIGVGAFHMVYITLTAEGRKEFRELLPKFRDFGDVGRNLLFFFGFARRGARFGRFSYLEKFDYWAVYWGMVVMIGSGLLLWFHDKAVALVPKVVLDIALEAHSDEALLATLAIVIWHFYNVHYNPHKFPGSLTWLHGKITKEEMIREHPLEYEGITGEFLEDLPIDEKMLIIEGLAEAESKAEEELS